MSLFEKLEMPHSGDKIGMSSAGLQVPDHPVIPFIEGDGTGPDIWRASVRVLDAAVENFMAVSVKLSGLKCMQGKKRITNLVSGCQTIRSSH